MSKDLRFQSSDLAHTSGECVTKFRAVDVGFGLFLISPPRLSARQPNHQPLFQLFTGHFPLINGADIGFLRSGRVIEQNQFLDELLA